MARVTVEDCIEKIPSRFELVMMASGRARKIGSGATPTVDRNNDKKTVIALRELAEETISAEALKEELILSHQRYLPQDPEEDVIDLMDGEEEWSGMEAKPAEPSGIYAEEEVSESSPSSDKSVTPPSLSDIAGI